MIYFSIDIETNGLAAGINSMISLGAAAIEMETGELVKFLKVNIPPLPDLQVDAGTMEWWKKFPEAYRRASTWTMPPGEAMGELQNWVENFGIEHPVAAAWKPGFDLAFLRYYLFRFRGGDLFGRSGSGLDIKTLTAIALNQSFSETQIATVPSHMKGPQFLGEHTHDALEDAIEQAYVMYNARKMLGVKL